MGMGKIKALKIRSIGFFAPDFLHVAFLGFSAKKRLRQKLKVMSEILSVPASRNNFAKKDRIDYSCGGSSLFLVLCNLSRRRRSGFYPCRGSVGDHDQEHDDGYDHQDFLDGTTFDPADEFCKHRIFLPDCVTLWLKLFTFVKITIKSVSR